MVEGTSFTGWAANEMGRVLHFQDHSDCLIRSDACLTPVETSCVRNNVAPSELWPRPVCSRFSLVYNTQITQNKYPGCASRLRGKGRERGMKTERGGGFTQ